MLVIVDVVTLNSRVKRVCVEEEAVIEEGRSARAGRGVIIGLKQKYAIFNSPSLQRGKKRTCLQSWPALDRRNTQICVACFFHPTHASVRDFVIFHGNCPIII